MLICISTTASLFKTIFCSRNLSLLCLKFLLKVYVDEQKTDLVFLLCISSLKHTCKAKIISKLSLARSPIKAISIDQSTSQKIKLVEVRNLMIQVLATLNVSCLSMFSLLPSIGAALRAAYISLFIVAY